MNALFLLLLGSLLPQDPTQPANPKAKQPPMPVPLGVVCDRGNRAIEIDGSLVDWPELPAVDLGDQRQLSGTAQNAWRGPKDLSAVAFAMWDKEAFYFACRVKDEWHRALDAQTLMSEMPVADSVVITFDIERNTRRLGLHRERIDDAEFWLSEQDTHKVLKLDRMRGSADMLEEGRQVVVHDKEAGITTYEVRIPWTDILPAGRSATAGMVFDFNVVVNDFDEIGRAHV